MRLPQINNDYYNHLNDGWYEQDRDPIAVLRAEQKVKNPWVDEQIQRHLGSRNLSIADIGCGGGFLTNDLANKYQNVYGLDASESTLEIARKMDKSGKVNYVQGDAYKLPYKTSSMDVVCAMDFLEHVNDPARVIKECERILKPGGLFFYHTFNRNPAAYLIVIKFMEWFVPNTPKNLHVYHLFIRPNELLQMFERMKNISIVGLRPKFNIPFLKSLFQRRVRDDFGFTISNSTILAYLGVAKKAGTL